jgi:hypothetical protein
MAAASSASIGVNSAVGARATVLTGNWNAYR